MRNNPFLYNRRLDKTGYQKPPKGRIVHTSESPLRGRDEPYVIAEPMPDPPPILVPTRDGDSAPYLQEVAPPEEGKNQLPEEFIVTIPIKEPGFKLDHGEQTATVVRIIRDNYVTGDHFTVATIYDGFSDDDVARWTKTYGSNVLRILSKAIVNVVWSEKHIRAKRMKDYDPITWRLAAKSGAPAPVVAGDEEATESLPTPPVMKFDFPPELTPAAGPYHTGYLLIGYTIDGTHLYKDRDGTIGIFTFTPHDEL